MPDFPANCLQNQHGASNVFLLRGPVEAEDDFLIIV